MSLKEQISGFFKIDELKDNFIKLIEAKFELKKFEIKEELQVISAKIIFYLIIATLSLIIYILLLLCIINTINKHTNYSAELGMIILHASIILALVINKNRILKAINDSIKKR